MNIIESHIEHILEEYTQGEYYEDMKEALILFSELTGKMNEDSMEYESRMNSFNEWFVFNYRLKDGMKVIDRYIQQKNIDSELAKAFHNISFSLFHFSKITIRKNIVIKDILHSEKIKLSKNNQELALVEDDIFTGRIVNYQDEAYLLRGLCLLPRDVLSILKKQSRKIRKLNSDAEEEKFLINLELLKTKSINYGHLETSKIFIFD